MCHLNYEQKIKNSIPLSSKKKKVFWWFILAIRRLWFIKFAFIKSLKSWLADFREEFSYWIMKFL